MPTTEAEQTARRVRFEIIELEEPELGATHLVITIDDKGEEIERFTTDNP